MVVTAMPHERCQYKAVGPKEKKGFPHSVGRQPVSFANMPQTIKTKQAHTYRHCNPELQNLT